MQGSRGRETRDKSKPLTLPYKALQRPDTRRLAGLMPRCLECDERELITTTISALSLVPHPRILVFFGRTTLTRLMLFCIVHLNCTDLVSLVHSS